MRLKISLIQNPFSYTKLSQNGSSLPSTNAIRDSVINSPFTLTSLNPTTTSPLLIQKKVNHPNSPNNSKHISQPNYPLFSTTPLTTPCTLISKELSNKLSSSPNSNSTSLSMNKSNDYPQILNNKGQSSSSISIITWNAHSLSSQIKVSFSEALLADIKLIQEVWHPDNIILDPLKPYSIQLRKESRGGGSLISLNPLFQCIRQYKLNEDSILCKIGFHSCKYLWIGNIYINKGNPNQLKAIFSRLEIFVPPEEWGRIVLGGDWNTNVDLDCPKTTLLLELANQFKLKVLAPGQTSSAGKTIDFFLIGHELLASGKIMSSTISDHLPVKININVPFPKPRLKLRIPNKSLAQKITIQNLLDSQDAFSFLAKMEQSLRDLYNQSMKTLKPPRWENKLLHNILESDESNEIRKIIRNYWRDLINSNEIARFSKESKNAFDFLRNVYKYDQHSKREGNIINAIIDANGLIISDPDQVNQELMKTIKELQFDPDDEQYQQPLEFTKLNLISKYECFHILKQISFNKALAFDLLSDVIISPKFIDHTSDVLKNLWSIDLNSIMDLKRHFKTRIIPLNKKYPSLPTRFDMRPIVTTSPLIKILEARFFPKLFQYQVEKLHPAQTGFIKGCGINVNLVRFLKRVKFKTSKKLHCFALFVDFKSAYNTIRHSILFEKPQSILGPNETSFLKALYSRLTLSLGKEKCVPNVGVAQGSLISPFLFNIYLEDLLQKLQTLDLSIEDLFAYADDLLVLCYSLTELEKVISLIKEWSSHYNLKLNPTKSGILELLPRSRRIKSYLEIGSKFCDIPIVGDYQYLGMCINQKLTSEAHLKTLNSRLSYISLKLSPILTQVSMKYCFNLWQLLVKPLLDPLAILSSLETAQSRQNKAEVVFRKSLKIFLNIGTTTPNSTLTYISGYDIIQRGKFLVDDATKRWELRKNRSTTCIPGPQPFSHKLKFAPKSLSKYIYMLNSMCPYCPEVRVSQKHLQKIHKLPVPCIEELCNDFSVRGNSLRRAPKETRKNVIEIVKEFEDEMKVHCEVLSNFLSLKY